MILKDIQKQLEEDRPLRQWQTDWPSTQLPNSGTLVILINKTFRKLVYIQKMLQKF